MPLRPDMELKDYLDILRRRKWLSLFSFLLVIFGASVYNVAMPEQYKSSTTILIIPQRVPENYVQSTVSVGTEDRLATIQQQVTSRTRLTAVMDDLGLFKEERRKKVPEEILDEMRKRVEIEVVSDKNRRRDRGGTEAFVISFVHESPNLAMLTASRLASLFIDENLKTREQQAVGTSEFLDSQLQDTKVKLEAQEERLKQYKLQFMGELPQELQSNLSVLTRLQDQAKTNADGLRAAQDRKVFLEAQLSLIERSGQNVVREDGRVETVHYGDPNQTIAGELALRRARLADLTAKFTDRYPEVVRLRREVEQLEAMDAGIRKSASTPDNGSVRKPPVPQPSTSLAARDSDELRRLKAQVMSTDAEIAALKAERETIQRQIGILQSKVDRSPRREQELISVTRDYQNLKASYDELLKKKLDADISQNLEKRQKGEQFQVIDPANTPTKPFKPNRKKIFGLAFLVAFGLALGGPIALEMADPTLRGVKDFKHFFDLPVLACIPVIRNEEYTRKLTVRKAAVFGGIASFTIAVSVFLLVFGQKIRALLNF